MFDPNSFEGQVIQRLTRIEANMTHVCEDTAEHGKDIDKLKSDVGSLKMKAALFGSVLGTVAGFGGAWLKTKLGL